VSREATTLAENRRFYVAKVLYETYIEGEPNAPVWVELTPTERQRWVRVADRAYRTTIAKPHP